MPLMMIYYLAHGFDPAGFRNHNTNGASSPKGESINRVATALARLALAGHAIHKGNCGDFTVCKYGMTKYYQDFTELQAFFRKLRVTK